VRYVLWTCTSYCALTFRESILQCTGMITGIQDAHNLAWKIAALIKGIAPSLILHTYETERRPILLLSFYFLFILYLEGSLTFIFLLSRIAMFNTALSIQNFRAAMAVPAAPGLDPIVANSGTQNSYFLFSCLAY